MIKAETHTAKDSPHLGRNPSVTSSATNLLGAAFADETALHREVPAGAAMASRIESLFTHGIQPRHQLRELGISITGGTDIEHAEREVNKVSVGLLTVSATRDYASSLATPSTRERLLDGAREMLVWEIARSPLGVMLERPGEKPISTLKESVALLGKEEAERRLFASAIVLVDFGSQTMRDIEKSPLFWGWDGVMAPGFKHIAPELLKAVFVPRSAYDLLKAGLAEDLHSKVRVVEGRCDLNSHLQGQPALNVECPDYATAIAQELRTRTVGLKNEEFATFGFHSTRLQS